MISIRILLLSAVWALLSGFTFAVTQGTEISFQAGIVEFPQTRNIRVNDACRVGDLDFGEFLLYLFSLTLLCAEQETNEFVRQRVGYLERSISLGLRHHFNASYGISIQGGAAKLEPQWVTYDEPEESPDFPVGEIIPAPDWEWVGGGVLRGIVDAQWATLEAGAHVQRFTDGWRARPSLRAALRPVKEIEIHASAMEGVSLVTNGVAMAGVRWQGERFRLGFAEQIVTHPWRVDSFAFTERLEVGARTDLVIVDVAGLFGQQGVSGAQIQIGLQLD